MNESEQIQKTEKSHTQSEIDREIEKEVIRMEENNYVKAKGINRDLSKVKAQYKSVIKKGQRQGEKISSVKKKYNKIDDNLNEASDIADRIEDEGRFWNLSRIIPFYGTIKSFFSCNRTRHEESGEDKDSDQLVYYESSISESNDNVKENSNSGEECVVPGQNKTDNELKNILGNLRDIRKYGESHKNILEKEKLDLKDIEMKNQKMNIKTTSTNNKLQK